MTTQVQTQTNVRITFKDGVTALALIGLVSVAIAVVYLAIQLWMWIIKLPPTTLALSMVLAIITGWPIFFASGWTIRGFQVKHWEKGVNIGIEKLSDVVGIRDNSRVNVSAGVRQAQATPKNILPSSYADLLPPISNPRQMEEDYIDL